MSESSSGSGFAYRAFISYSHADQACAEWLHKALETYRVPSRLVGTQTSTGVIPHRLAPIFRDRDELASADDLGRKVNAALSQSEALIVICSPHSAQSRWVNEEVLAFKRLGRTERIFCLIVDGEPGISDWPGHDAEECFCPALRFKLDESGQPTRERTESLAADARPGKDGNASSKLKLIAGLLGVGLDQLKQRHQHRQMRRMLAITALALVVMAITSVLAVYALISRRAAVIAQQSAQRRQKQAESLVDFMLGNLSDKLSAESRLDIMQDVDNHAMAYFKSLPATDVNDTALAQRAKALEKIGIVRDNSGDSRGALLAFNASTAISSKLAAAAPANAARQIAYSKTLAWIGMIHWQQGKLADAEHDFESARQTTQPSLERTPNEVSLLEQLTYLDNDLDHVLAAQGRPEVAIKMARDRMKLDERLLALKPDDGDYNDDLAAAHNELGRLHLQRGDLAEAIAENRANTRIMTRLSARNPGNQGFREDLLEALGMLGQMSALSGNSVEGIQDLQRAVDMAGQLMKYDPKNMGFGEDFAGYSSELARLKRLTGDARYAASVEGMAVAQFAALTRKDPTDSVWQRAYAEALTEQAEESRAAGDITTARTSAQRALNILAPMLAKHPDERKTLLATMTTKLLLASVTTDPSVAQSLREQAMQTMQSVKVDRGDPRLLALQVEALLSLGRQSDSQPLIKQLWNEGYRDIAFVAVLQHAHIDYPANPAFQARLASAEAQGDAYSLPHASAGTLH